MKTKPIIDRDKWKQPRIQWSNGRTLPRTARVDASGEKMPQHQSVAEKVVGKESKETHANEEVLSETMQDKVDTIQPRRQMEKADTGHDPWHQGGHGRGLSRQPKRAESATKKALSRQPNYFTSCDPHHDIYTFSYWQIFWHSI